jgi:TPR repeat protein
VSASAVSFRLKCGAKTSGIIVRRCSEIVRNHLRLPAVGPAARYSLAWDLVVSHVRESGHGAPGNSVQFIANRFDSYKCRAVVERGKRDIMNSRSCHWLIVLALVITASGAWTQQSAPPASDQTLATGLLSETPKAAQCSLPAGFDQMPPVFDQNKIAAFKQKASGGNAAAQCGLGLLYNNGWGVLQDSTQAVAWWRKAAEQGSAAAQYFLGLMYVTGNGVMQQDSTQAAAWWRKAAEQGYAMGQGNLGGLYYEGRGVPQDYSQAEVWWRKAAEQGDAEAQKNLARLYYKGQGVPQDYAQAVAWYHKAAEQGDAEAQYMLGGSYDYGQGVPQDYSEAYFWLDLAAAGKLNASLAEAAATIRDGAASHLTPADLSREQERARIWFEAHRAKP